VPPSRASTAPADATGRARLGLTVTGLIAVVAFLGCEAAREMPAQHTAGASPGSAPVGSTSYAVPAGALLVAPSGSDAAAGTGDAPFRSVARAIAVAHSGQTIVLRKGTYHESVTVPATKKLTIQSYPAEAVWFDGSRTVTNWVSSGTTWRADGWTTRFDASPTFTRGAPDGTSANWRWVNPAYPMAAHPDQLWMGGRPQQQVQSLGQVRPGTFFADYANQQLYVGTDPLEAGGVRASDLRTAIILNGSGSVLRGVGVRDYAPSIPDFGAVSVRGQGVTLENVVITNSATIGLSVEASDTTVRRMTVTHAGLLGIQANAADRLVIDRSRADGNNAEHFNTTPVAGGVKVAHSRTVSILDGAYGGNEGCGLWLDDSVYGARITGNDLQHNTTFGVRAELSARVTVANNLVTFNGDDGIRVANTSGAQIWNNTIVGNLRSISFTQDSRLASDPSVPGHDTRQPFPDPTMTWLTGTSSVGNNVMALERPTADALFAVEDFTRSRSASSMGIATNGNVYNRLTVSVPRWAVVWSRAGTDPAVHVTVATFSQATGQERNSLSVDGSSAVNADFSLVPAVRARTAATAQPLPGGVAALVGQRAGTRHLGVWR
jgi:parallel beta-helix repeat protein